ncbi:MAG: hypothetical protein ABIQ38_01740 [Ilumatobacteraceae bacterium]
MNCFWWTARLALVVTLGSCSQPSDPLSFQLISESAISDSTARNFQSPESSPAPQSVAPAETTTEQVAAEFSYLIDLRLQCGRLPVSCPVSKMTVPDSTYHRYLAKLMKVRAAANLATRAGAGQFRFRIDRIDLLSPVSAIVHTCIFDSLVVFDMGRSDAIRDDIVFDDDVISGHTEWKVVLHDGSWKWSDATGDDTTYGKDICGFIS